MPITTPSASDVSARPRATVAPTFPAPPTTVTLRFISCLCPLLSCVASAPSRVADNGIRECRRLQLRRVRHLPREVVGHLLLADRPFDPALDEGARFVPAQIVEHHHPGQNQ